MIALSYRVSRIFVLAFCFAVIFSPTFSIAQKTPEAREAQYADLIVDLDVLYREFSGLPFGPLRKSELEQIMQERGFKWHDGVKDYSRAGPWPETGRRLEQFVQPKLCGGDDAENPLVESYLYGATALRDDQPARMIDMIKSSPHLSRYLEQISGDGYEDVTLFFQIPTVGDTFWHADVRALSSSEHTQKITMLMQTSCP